MAEFMKESNSSRDENRHVVVNLEEGHVSTLSRYLSIAAFDFAVHEAGHSIPEINRLSEKIPALETFWVADVSLVAFEISRSDIRLVRDLVTNFPFVGKFGLGELDTVADKLEQGFVEGTAQ